MSILRQLVLIAPLLALCPVLAAQEENKKPGPAPTVQFQVTPSFGERYSGPLIPIFVEGTNPTDRDLTLDLRLESRRSTAEGEGRPLAVRRDTLARGSSKRWFLYYSPRFWTGNVMFRAMDKERNKSIYEQPLNLGEQSHYEAQTPFTLMVLSFSPKLVKELRGDQNRVFSASPMHLPDHWAAYTGFNAVLIDDYPFKDVTAQQQEALRQWIQLGGTTIISPGFDPAWLTSGFVKDLVPLESASSERVKHWLGLRGENAQRDFVPDDPITRYTLKSPSLKVEEKAGSHPILWSSRYGNGTVYVLSMPIGSRPFTDWNSLSWFVNQRLTHIRSQGGLRDFAGEQNQMYRFTSEVDPLLDIKLGTLLLPLSVFVLIYLAILGPANFLYLRRKQRPALYFFTAPAVALGFAVLLTGGAYTVRGTSTRAVAVNVIEARSGSVEGVERTYLAIVSPGTGGIDLGLGRTGWISGTGRNYQEYRQWEEEGQIHGGYYYRPHEDPSRYATSAPHLEVKEGIELKGYPVRKWEVASFIGTHVRDLGKGVRIAREGNRYTIANHTRMKIVGGVYAETVASLDHLRAGHRTAVRVDVFKVGSLEPGGSIETEILSLDSYEYGQRQSKGEFDLLPRESYEWRLMAMTAANYPGKLVLVVEDPARPLVLDGRAMDYEKVVTFLVMDIKD